jgi:HEAT repeat protein
MGAASELTLTISKAQLEVDGTAVLIGQAAARTFALELYHRGVACVRFSDAVDAEAVLTFLRVLQQGADDTEQAGSFETTLWDLGVRSITVADALTSVVDVEIHPAQAAQADIVLPDHEEIDELLATVRQAGSHAHRLLMRVLLDKAAVIAYISASYDRTGTPDEGMEPGGEILAMARVIDTLSEEERAMALAAVAEAVVALPAEKPRAQIAERLLTAGRTDHAVAALVRQIGLDEMSKLLVEGVPAGDVSAEGLMRAVRNLAHIHLASREEVVNSAGAAMRGANIPEPMISEALTMAMPTHVIAESDYPISEALETPGGVLRLLDIAAAAPMAQPGLPEVQALRDEANRGFTDGDVTEALVTLIVLDIGREEFFDSLRLVEDDLSILLRRGEFETAARAADILLAAVADAPAEQGKRVVDAVGRLADEPELRALHRALRVFDKGAAESLACERLLRTLGMLAIDSSLELLANEEDTALRRSMVEIISSVAEQHIEELGRRITDGRWYFVRNVVAILGTTKRSEALPYLERTLHHVDMRVRRESIRAIASVFDPRSAELIVAALGDMDAEVVQIAARYLGSFRNPTAVPALIEVARGEGAGNRDQGARIRAIEAQGQIGSADACPALEALATPRKLAGGRSRELAQAATAAMEAIRRISQVEP